MIEPVTGPAHEYEMTLLMVHYEGVTMWHIVQTLMLPQTVLLTLLGAGVAQLLDPSRDAEGVARLVLVGALAGFLLTVLWRSAFERHNTYYRFRIHQAVALEERIGYSLLREGRLLADGKAASVSSAGETRTFRMPLITGKRFPLGLGDLMGPRLLSDVFLSLFVVIGAAAYIVAPFDGMTLPLTNWPTIVQAVAGAAAASAAIVALCLQWWGSRQKRKAVDGRISAVAYALRRELRAMLGDPQQHTNLAAYKQWGGDAQKGFDVTEKRVQSIATDAPQATRAVRKAALEAYVLFYSATGRLNVLRDSSSPIQTTGQEYVLREYQDAERELQRCIAELEKAIDKRIRDR